MGGQKLLDAAFWARIPVNLVDKGIAVGAAFVVYRVWRRPISSRA
jgi:hypothetical protein